MNALSIIGDIYGFVGACFIIAKIRFHRRIRVLGNVSRLGGSLANPPMLDREATDDFLDLMAFFLICSAFVFQILGEFWSIQNWAPVLLADLPAAISLVILADKTEIWEFDRRSGRSTSMTHTSKLGIIALLSSVTLGSAVAFIYAAVFRGSRELSLIVPSIALGWLGLLMIAFAQNIVGKSDGYIFLRRTPTLLQEQKLLKLDAVMLLAYPLVMLGICAFAFQLLQLSSLLNTRIFEVPLVLPVLVFLAYFLIVVLGLRGYLESWRRNDVRGRVRACKRLVWGGLAMLFESILFLMIPVSIYLGKQYPTAVTFAFFILTGYANLAILDFCNGIVSKSQELVVRWIERNAPSYIRGTEISSRDLALEVRRNFLSVKTQTLLMCAFAVPMSLGYALWMGVHGDGLAFIGVIAAGLVTVTLVIWRYLPTD